MTADFGATECGRHISDLRFAIFALSEDGVLRFRSGSWQDHSVLGWARLRDTGYWIRDTEVLPHAHRLFVLFPLSFLLSFIFSRPLSSLKVPFQLPFPLFCSAAFFPLPPFCGLDCQLLMGYGLHEIAQLHMRWATDGLYWMEALKQDHLSSGLRIGCAGMLWQRMEIEMGIENRGCRLTSLQT
ncbi:hypothetical protein K491DRAFT_22870 [Lophiostoma macrostomum CBS 122681]|uniref:Uncharacterized protein n=1 Tax=Lophiostoma macrostomum CBS 122681 TaxID=1314788 RepID=A0A6A6T157_9PLEO|nr:hypothetical protein K491DRAFT_22870 [Lophiostoma macrostomum CBS 122681]